MSLLKGQWNSIWQRGQMLTAMRALMGSPRLLIDGFDTPTAAFTELSGRGHTVTPTDLLNTDQSYKGLGKTYDYGNSATACLDVPDSDDFSFCTGSTDLPFTVGVLIRVVPSLSAQAILSKWGSLGREWLCIMNSSEEVGMYLCDESAGQFCSRWGDILPTDWYWIVMSYSAATGGATAGSDLTIYIDGEVNHALLYNNASYVRMENTPSSVVVGGRNNTGVLSLPFGDNIGLTFVDGTCWTQAQVTSSYNTVKEFYRL